MDYSKATPEEAYIQLLHIAPDHEMRLRRLINRLWFFYRLEVVSSQHEEEKLFCSLNDLEEKDLFDLVIANFSSSSPLNKKQQQKLIAFLRQTRRPLINLTDQETYSCDDSNPDWINISLPIDKIEQHTIEANDAITNFWYCLPSLQKSR